MKLLGFARQSLFVLFSIFPTSLWAVGGGWSGNGGTSALDQDNPWFLGAEPIPYCVMKTQGRVPTSDAIRHMIKQNSEKWNQFFNRYQINGFGESIYLFPDRAIRKITNEFVESSDCVEVERNCGAEHFDELKCESALKEKVLFLFGKPNTIVKKYLETHGKAEGLALRTSYNHITYRSGGIVWINQLKLGGWTGYQHMLLHEMGHVLGMVHDSCWVMSENVAQIINQWVGIGIKGEIESPNWPYSYLPHDNLIFTDGRVSKDNLPAGFYPNRLLPESLREKFGFEYHRGFKLSAKVVNADITFADLNLIFEESETGQRVEWFAKLQKQSSSETYLTPRLYTKWTQNHLTDSFFNTNFLYKNWVASELHGKVIWDNQAIPMILKRKRGLSLSFFYAPTGTWSTFETLQW